MPRKPAAERAFQDAQRGAAVLAAEQVEEPHAPAEGRAQQDGQDERGGLARGRTLPRSSTPAGHPAAAKHDRQAGAEPPVDPLMRIRPSGARRRPGPPHRRCAGRLRRLAVEAVRFGLVVARLLELLVGER